MAQNFSEIRRTLDEVELLEQLRFDLKITAEEYRSTHRTKGKIRGKVHPDNETRRARKNPPKGPLERVAASVKGVNSFAAESGYPETDCFVGLTRVPPVARDAQAHENNVDQQRFEVDGLPDNGTVRLEGDWSAHEITNALENDELAFVEHEYDIVDFPSDQLPIVLRANLHRDAREYIENKLEANLRTGASRYEGQAVLSLEVEFPGDAPEAERAGGTGSLTIDNFRVDMESTFSDIEFLAKEKGASDHTYNPEKKRVEWRGRTVRKGDTIRYDIVGPVRQLLAMGHISAGFRGVLSGHTLTGTQIRALYDRAGDAFVWHEDGQLYADSDVTVSHRVQITSEIEIDPEALSGDTRQVTTATVNVNDAPSDAFDRVETVCRKEAMTIRDITPPANPEPVKNRDGVFQITAEENNEGDDQPGLMEVKREYGDRGVVYANIQVTGQFTSMTQDSEVSTFDQSEDRLVRSDEGGLETRGKSEVEIKARSADSELNADLISKIKQGLTGVGGGEQSRPGESRSDNTLPPEERRALESDVDGDNRPNNGGDQW